MNSKKIKIENYVAEQLCVTTQDITGRSRKRENVFPRHLSMWMYDKLTGVSLEKNGQIHGNRDHCTVIHALKCMNNYMEVDKHKTEIITQIFNNYLKVMENEKLSIEELEQNIIKWAKEKNLIKKDNTHKQLVKTIEELGEVARAVCKNDKHALIDGIGDVIVTLGILAAQNETSLTECLTAAWTEIKDRTGQTIDGIFVKSK